MDYEAMANEELAVRAREGDMEAESVLWENVYRLIQKLTRRYLTHCTAAGIEPDDMMQECWIGFHDAVMGYQSGRSLFTSYLGFHIKKVCMNALHIQNGKIRQVPTVPIDAPVKDGEDVTIADLVADESIDVTGGIELTDLQRVVRGAVARLTDREQDVIHHAYVLQRPVTEWAEAQEIGRSRGNQIHAKALRKLKRDPAIRAFQPYYVREGGRQTPLWEIEYQVRRHDGHEAIERRIDDGVSLYLAWCADNGIQPDETGKRRDLVMWEVSQLDT